VADGVRDLDALLSLVLETRRAEAGGQWKADPDAAIERYGEACDAVWRELNRLLDERLVATGALPAPPVKSDPMKVLRKRIAARLKADLPALIAGLVDEEISHAG
jgi:hypothetical protein